MADINNPTQLISSPRRIFRMVQQHAKDMSAFYDDPITHSCGCAGEIGSMLDNRFRETIRRTTIYRNDYEVSCVAEDYAHKQRVKRLRFKNPVRLAWKREQSNARYHLMMVASMEMGWDTEEVESF